MLRVWKFVFLVGLCRGVSNAGVCKSVGKFPNDQLPNCRGFTTCNEIQVTGTFFNYDLPCPPTFIFNHIDHQCSNATGYRCFPDYNCTTEGNFDYPENKNCTSYIACISGLTNIVTARLIDCSLGTVFSPLVGQCVDQAEYTCPRELSTTTSTIEDLTTEMFFIYNNNLSITECSNKEFPSMVSSSTVSSVSFQILILPLITAYSTLLV